MYQYNVIKSKRLPLNLKVSLLLLLVFTFNSDLNSINLIWWGTVAVYSIFCIANILKSHYIKINAYIIWLMVFNLWGLLSYFWSINEFFTLNQLKTSAKDFVLLMLLSLIIKTREDIFDILKLIVIATVITVIYILFTIDISLIGEVAIGRGALGEGWNANAIGLIASLSVLSCFAFLKQNNKKFYKVFYILTILLLTYICLFTGSRKTLFILLIGVSLFFLFTSKNKKIVIFCIVSFSVLLSYYIIMSVPVLYNVLGIRLEGFFAQITGQGLIDSSTLKRMKMIEYGIEWFKENPIFGYGFNTYRALYFAVSNVSTYSHNNYIELLVNVGIIGTAIYYFMYFIIIRSLLSYFKKKDSLIILFLISSLLITVLDYVAVSYNLFIFQLFICLAYSAINTYEGKENIDENNKKTF